MKKILFTILAMIPGVLIFFPLSATAEFTGCEIYGPHAYPFENFCKCEAGYVFGTNSLGQTTCRTHEEICIESFGQYSIPSGTECGCQSGYTFYTDPYKNKSCVDFDTYCRYLIGDASSYDIASDSCVCDPGYSFEENTAVNICTSCSEKYGNNSFYNPLSDSCECKNGYIADDFGVCIAKSSSCGFRRSYIESTGSCECSAGFVEDNGGNCVREEDLVNTPVPDQVDPPIITNPFSDISEAYRFKDAVLGLADQGVLSGYNDGTFRPNQGVTRAEFLKIVMEGQAPTGGNCFNDVSDEWYGSYVCHAKDQGWVQGYPDGGFHPNANITQAEAFKIALMAKSIQVDGVSGPEWYSPLVQKVRSSGFLPDDILNYNQNITRGEVSELIWNIIK